MMKRMSLFTFYVFLILLLCSCTGAKGDAVSSDLEFLTSDSLSGRLCFTKDAEETVSFLTQRLDAAGLEPFSDSFASPFENMLPTGGVTKLTIRTPQGEIVLHEGVDYITSLLPAVSIQGILQEETERSGVRTIPVETDGEMGLVLKQADFRGGNPLVALAESVEVCLFEEAMDIVCENSGQPIEFTCTAEESAVTMQNVIGVLPGKDRSRAVVVGAHFDHMGALGNTVYFGAVDNASGVSAVLAMADTLSEKQPDVDIVFAFWNAEEVGKLGSLAAAESLRERYEKICYINIDCIALKGGGPVLVTTTNYSDTFTAALTDLLAENGYDNAIAAQEQIAGDHESFPFCGAAHLGQSMVSFGNIIHHPSDTRELLDTDEISKLSGALARVLSKSANELMEAANQRGTAAKTTDIVWPEGDFEEMDAGGQIKYMEAVRKQLAYDEYVVFPSGRGMIEIAGADGEYFSSLAEAQKFYPLISIAEQFSGYTLKQIYIYTSDIKPAVQGTGEKPWQVIKRSFSMQDISAIQAWYEADGRAICYRENYYSEGTRGVDAESSARSYGWAEKAPGKEDAWISYDEQGGYPFEYVMQYSDTTIAAVSEGEPFVSSDGIYTCLAAYSSEFSLETLLAATDLIAQSQPLISMIGFTK
jgi:hypothetical protein